MSAPVRQRISIPIYEVFVWIVVDEDALARRIEFNEEFGEYTDGPFKGLCSSEGDVFGLFFYPGDLTRNTIAHETFHLTHRILQYIGAEFDPDNHETFSWLCGYLTERVYEVAMGEK